MTIKDPIPFLKLHSQDTSWWSWSHLTYLLHFRLCKTPPYCCQEIQADQTFNSILQGRTQGGVGLTPPLELDILRKLYYLRKGD